MTTVFGGPSFQLRRSSTGDLCVVSAVGELDLAAAPALAQALEDAARSTSGSVELDLSGVTFIDSSGIRAVLDCVMHSRGNGTRLHVRRDFSAPVQRTLDLIGVLGWLSDLESDGTPTGDRPPAARGPRQSLT